MTVRIMVGDVRARLKELPDESVHCIWTSIPYWGLRSYGTEPQVWDGEADCAHVWGAQQRNGKRQDIRPSSETTSVGRVGVDERQGTAVLDGGRFCRHCGAWRGEHGLEPSLDMWLQHEVEIWRELRRVLRKDGTAWLNCGDAYATSTNGRSAADTKAVGNDDRTFRDKPVDTTGSGLKSKQRLMLPARVALALQADGWWLRDEIVWHKLNPMPSSVGDRTTPAHEMLYLLTKSARYYFDAEAISEPASYDPSKTKFPDGWDTGPGGHGSIHRDGREKGRRNSFHGGAKYVEGGDALAAQSARQHVSRAADVDGGARPPTSRPHSLSEFEAKNGRNYATRNKRSVWPLVTEPFPGAHFATAPTELVKPCILAGCPKGGTVLDPFGGSGTTGMVADRLGRDAILIELNPDYAAIARDRVHGDAPMFADVQTTEAA